MLGQELVRVFSDTYTVHAWDKDDLDITDKDMCEKMLKECAPDIVINAAAFNAVDAVEENEDTYKKAQEINGVAPGYLAKVCKELDVLFVHFSTDYVFDGNNIRGYKEDDTPNPVNKYGQTKYLGEQNVQKNAEKYYIIRLSKLFGQPGTGEGSKKSFVDTMLWLVREGGKDSLNLVHEETGSPTYAPDLANAVKELIEEDTPSGIYHITNDGACTWYEFAKEVFLISGETVNTAPVSGDAFPRPAKRPMHSTLNNTKLKLLRSWQEALQAYLT